MLNQTIAQERLSRMIETGKANVLNVINRIQSDVPEDLIAPTSRLSFQPANSGVALAVADRQPYTIHRHALSQIAQRGEISGDYVNTLMDKGDWGKELLSRNLNELYSHQFKKYLVRSVATQVRGFLSDSYRRLDSRPIVDAFCGELQRIGALPYEGYALDTKINIQAIMPNVFTAAGEAVIFGMTVGNSDFGDGALEATSFVVRLICSNGAIGQDVLRRIHLGKRLSDDIQFSNETYRLDTRTAVSSIKDITRHILGPDRIAGYIEAVNHSAQDTLTPGQVTSTLKRFLNKSEVEAVTNLYKSADVVNLPAGNSAWRLSNALSWLANQPDTAPEKKLELQKVAGEVLTPAA